MAQLRDRCGRPIGAAGATLWMVGGRLGPAFTLALAVWGLPIAVIGLVPVGWLAFGLLAVVGIANAALDVAGLTLIRAPCRTPCAPESSAPSRASPG